MIAETAFFDLDAPIARVCTEEVPIPYAKHLEYEALPQVEEIMAAVDSSLGFSNVAAAAATDGVADA